MLIPVLFSSGFTTDSLERLCKGLHYALWMQDKMLLQEELADNILQLLGLLKDQNQIFEFVKALLFTLSKEWPKIDRWRMDKFLMVFFLFFEGFPFLWIQKIPSLPIAQTTIFKFMLKY